MPGGAFISIALPFPAATSMQSSYHITFTANVRWALHAIHMKVALPFDDFSIEPPAPWMSQIRNLEYMLGHSAIFPNPMYNIPGVTPLTVCIDWMHTKYLGTDQYFPGSVLFTLCHFLMHGVSAAANCAEIWKHVKAEYRIRKTPTRYRVLKLTMFCSGSGGYPCLKGKAHAIKHLGLILRDLFNA